MSPVGSFESLVAALQGGANSIYFGIEKLNMRSKSTFNFSITDMVQISEFCRINNLKSYLTLNTVMYDTDIELVKEILKEAKKTNITAVIASDMSVITEAVKLGVEVHISTQLNVSNSLAIKYYSQFADVVVLARELNLSQVRKIYDTIIRENITGPSGNLVKIEMFVHGALCMAISGKCYLSLHDQNKSANRGECYQICRKAYVVTEKENGNQLELDNEYIMSPKDLCTIGFIDELIESGVSVFKIEGRARSPEYVKTVTSSYRTAVDAYFKGLYNSELTAELIKKLSTAFNRGFWNGYYLGQKLGEWSKNYGSSATKKKVYVGKITNYFDKISVAEILIEAGEVNIGENFIITGPTTGVIDFVVKEIRVDLKNTLKASKGECCSIPLQDLVRRNDKLYKIVDSTELNLKIND